MPTVTLSIVILAWNGLEDLTACVNSILQHKIEVSWELIIVDNGSSDATRAYLEALQQEIGPTISLKIILNSTNLGYAKGNNVSISSLEGLYTLLLNQDIIVQEQAINQLVNFLEGDNSQRYGLVAPKLLYPDGRIQLSCRKLPTPLTMLQNYICRSWNDGHVFDYNNDGECEQPMASAIMMRTELFKTINGFDDHPNFWLFFNDVDLSKKIAQQGYKSYFLAQAIMIHHHGGSTRTLISFKKTLLWHKGLYQYFKKWHTQNPFQVGILMILVSISFIGLFLRNIIRSKFT